MQPETTVHRDVPDVGTHYLGVVNWANVGTVWGGRGCHLYHLELRLKMVMEMVMEMKTMIERNVFVSWKEEIVDVKDVEWELKLLLPPWEPFLFS